VADPVRYPACRRFSRTAGVNLRNGMPFYQAAKGSVSALTCFHRFTREMGSRHAAFASKSPSNPFAPISCIEVGLDDYKGGAAGSQFKGGNRQRQIAEAASNFILVILTPRLPGLYT
jgi:hypothetical protein